MEQYMSPFLNRLRVVLATASILCLQPCVLVHGQTGCPNLGFENGDFSGWTGATGSCCPINTPNVGIVNGRHTMMSGNGVDPVTGVIPVVAPGGGEFSVRLGNEDVNAQAERLSYSMTVGPENALFVYRYAVVLQDPQHSDFEQPRFQIRMFNGQGEEIECGLYNVTATSGIEGFEETTYDGDILLYKDWTVVGMDLSDQMGETVTIEFSTGDCSQEGHFGYAYMDCSCSALQISSDYCPGLESTTLTAPEGFASYEWSTGDNTASIVVEQPADGAQYTCTITSVTGCAATLTTILAPSVIDSRFAWEGDCMNNVVFADSSVVVSGPPIAEWNWDFGDGVTSEDQNPFHAFSSPGTHIVTLVALSNNACPDTTVVVLDLLPSPQAQIVVQNACEGTPVTLLSSTVSTIPLDSLIWEVGDSTTLLFGSPVQHVYPATGSYTVTLLAVDENGCSDTTQTELTIFPNPLADLGPDRNICPGEVLTLAETSGQTVVWNTGTTDVAVEVDVAGTYWADLTVDGCTHRDSIIVLPTTDLGILDETVFTCPGIAIELAIPYEGGQYLWGSGDTSRTIVTDEIGAYTYVLIDTFNCPYEGNIALITDPLELGVVVPNVFSPDGNGVNDRFEPMSGGAKNVEVEVYNRFGQSVWSSNTLERLWDGTVSGNAVPDGTYFYRVHYTPSCTGGLRELTGALTLLRGR